MPGPRRRRVPRHRRPGPVPPPVAARLGGPFALRAALSAGEDGLPRLNGGSQAHPGPPSFPRPGWAGPGGGASAGRAGAELGESPRLGGRCRIPRVGGFRQGPPDQLRPSPPDAYRPGLHDRGPDKPRNSWGESLSPLLFPLTRQALSVRQLWVQGRNSRVHKEIGGPEGQVRNAYRQIS